MAPFNDDDVVINAKWQTTVSCAARLYLADYHDFGQTYAASKFPQGRWAAVGKSHKSIENQTLSMSDHLGYLRNITVFTAAPFYLCPHLNLTDKTFITIWTCFSKKLLTVTILTNFRSRLTESALRGLFSQLLEPLTKIKNICFHSSS